MPWRIKSLTEVNFFRQRDPLYLNHEVGWVTKRLADVISDDDFDNARIPLPENAEWEVAEDS